jgi:predicted DNA-binding ribbon-helix-helix protein
MLKGHVVSCRLTDDEHNVLKDMCVRNGCSMQVMLRAIVIDAIYDETLNVRRREQERCTST